MRRSLLFAIPSLVVSSASSSSRMAGKTHFRIATRSRPSPNSRAQPTPTLHDASPIFNSPSVSSPQRFTTLTESGEKSMQALRALADQ